MAPRMGPSPRSGRCSAAAAASVIIAVAVMAATAAAAPTARTASGAAVEPAAAGGPWASAAAAAVAAAATAAPPPVIRGVLPSVGRPLADDVSVLTDGTYTLLDEADTRLGCPTSIAIAGPLTTNNGTFAVEPPRLTIGGVACVGSTAEAKLFGAFGATLIDIATRAGANINTLLRADPNAAIAFVLDGPITCGAASFNDAQWTFLVASGVPALQLSNGDVRCALAAKATAPTPPPLIAQALAAGSLAGMVRALGGGGAGGAGHAGM